MLANFLSLLWSIDTPKLARFWQLCKSVFSFNPSKHLGVSAEIMASGVVLISSGVGGSSSSSMKTKLDIIPADSAASLTDAIKSCLIDTKKLLNVALWE